METPNRYRIRLRLARVVLGLAAAFMIAMQFTTMDFFGGEIRIYRNWREIGKGVMWMLRGNFDLLGVTVGGIFILIHLFVWAQPFLAVFYTRNRAFLWTARLIAIAPWLWLIFGGGIFLVIKDLIRLNPDLLEACLLAIVFLLPIGLFLVPVRRWEPPQEGPEHRG